MNGYNGHPQRLSFFSYFAASIAAERPNPLAWSIISCVCKSSWPKRSPRSMAAFRARAISDVLELVWAVNLSIRVFGSRVLVPGILLPEAPSPTRRKVDQMELGEQRMIFIIQQNGSRLSHYCGHVSDAEHKRMLIQGGYCSPATICVTGMRVSGHLKAEFVRF